MSRFNRNVIPFQQTRRFTDEEIDAARPDDDDETRVDFTTSNQMPEVNMFGNLYTDSSNVIEIFKADEEPDTAEFLREYQELHGIMLTKPELAKMLGWMDDLSQKALRQKIQIEKARRSKLPVVREPHPGIVNVSEQARNQHRGEAS